MRGRSLRSLALTAAHDLFDQSTGIGRLALAHVAMMVGDTFVTVSLASSLFFSVSPTEAKGRVLAYLLFTIAPFAVVSPVLGPLIDRSSNGRRVLIAVSAGLRMVLCWEMSQHLNSLWLYPDAFAVLVASKLYVVTRGTLVPEMARSDQLRSPGSTDVSPAGWSRASDTPESGFAGFNAQLTLLGTVFGLVGGVIAAGILKSLGAPAVLLTASVVYAGAMLQSGRLPRPAVRARVEAAPLSQAERDLQALRPFGEAQLAWGLIAASLMRFAAGFTTFLLAFGLRREHAGLAWFAAALAVSGLGTLGGLSLVTRLRDRVRESLILTLSLVATALGALFAGVTATLVAQVLLAAWLGVWTAAAQPSFDAITQRLVAPGAQGRTFARFAVRQQLAWVVGAVIPVGVALPFATGDWLLATVTALGAVTYAVGRRSTRPL